MISKAVRILDFTFNEKDLDIFETVHFCSLSQMLSVAAYTDDHNLARSCVDEFEKRIIISANFLS